MSYTYMHGTPVYLFNETTYYRIEGYNIIGKYENEKEVKNWRSALKGFEKPVIEWSDRFWDDLMKAPRLEVRANQWYSDYISFFDDRIFSWGDDRHENYYPFNRSYEIEEYLNISDISETEKSWIKKFQKKN